MSAYIVLIEIGGAVTLLLWAVRMIRTGVERSHEYALRALLRDRRGGRLRAAAMGGFAAVVLQSATAVAILAAGFASSGSLSLPTGLAMMLGADLGSALAARLLSISHEWLAPVLITAGGVLFFRGTSRTVRQWGRILFGIALVLIALRMLAEATGPLRHSEIVPMVATYLTGDVVAAFTAAALFTWLVHSSVAAVLMAATLAGQGLIPIELGVSLILGANVGGGLVALGLTRAAPVAAKRITVGNLAMRITGAVAALCAYHLWRPELSLLGETVGAQMLGVHIAFNFVVLVVFLPLTGPVAALVKRLVGPAETEEETATAPSFLDAADVGHPQQALANAKRELLRMAEIVERMLQPVMDIYESGDPVRIRQIKQMEDAVNRTQSDIKLYLMQIQGSDGEGERASLRGHELASFAVSLAHVGDSVSQSLVRLASTRRDQGLKFSAEGWRELNELHHRVMQNMQLALNVLISEDRECARLLVSEKAMMREAGQASVTHHLERLRQGSVQSLETSDIHLETVRIFRAINSMLTSIAYPILARTDELLLSRLTPTPD